jgi:uncharacterized membrane protein YeaQ/YmgE (transglycosylase-associated protein family)
MPQGGVLFTKTKGILLDIGLVASWYHDWINQEVPGLSPASPFLSIVGAFVVVVVVAAGTRHAAVLISCQAFLCMCIIALWFD